MTQKLNEQEKSYFHDENGLLMANLEEGKSTVVSKSYIKVIALIHDEHGSEWNVLIEFYNSDKEKRELEVPRSVLVDPREVTRMLLQEGFPAVGLNRQLLLKYLRLLTIISGRDMVRSYEIQAFERIQN